MRVVGSSPAVPRPGSACSCYLVQTARTSIMLDCGSGALASLQQFLDPAEVDVVIISHFHPDHVFDLVPLRYLRAFASEVSRPLDVFVHRGGIERLERLGKATASREGRRFFEKSMRPREYNPKRTLQVGGLHISFAKTVHSIEAYAMRVTDGTSTIVYSADTAPCARVVRLARDADLFICEASLGAAGAERKPRGHCTAAEAGRMAQEAFARRLLLTHYDAQSSPDELAAEAAREYSGEIEVAKDGWCNTLDGSRPNSPSSPPPAVVKTV